MKVVRYLPDRNRELKLYQRPALRWMLKQDNPALFVDMRLGKSLITIEWCIRKKLKRILVLCPKTAIVSWLEELRLEDIKPVVLDNPKTKKRAILNTPEGWTLTNYETVHNNPLHLVKWNCIILDESHIIKNPRANITNCLLKYYTRVKHKVLLTGTPNPEAITETVTQLIFKDGECLGSPSYWHFRAKYMKLVGFDWVLRPGIYDKLKARLHETAYFLTQKGAGYDITEIDEPQYFKFNAIQEKHTAELIRDFETTVGGKKFTTKYVLAQTIWLSMVASGYINGEIINPDKENWLKRYFNQNKDKQFIVWFRSNAELFRIKEVLTCDTSLKVASLYGKCKLQERIDIQKQFQDGRLDVVLIQVKLGKYSLNLSKAYEAIYFSNSYSNEERMQSKKRIVHINRKTIPRYKDLIFKDSVEEELYKMLKSKMFTFRFLWDKIRRIQGGKNEN